MTGQDAARYGFRWDQVDVTRACELNDGRKVVQIATDKHPGLDIYISRTGRSVRVFCEGKELKR